MLRSSQDRIQARSEHRLTAKENPFEHQHTKGKKISHVGSEIRSREKHFANSASGTARNQSLQKMRMEKETLTETTTMRMCAFARDELLIHPPPFSGLFLRVLAFGLSYRRVRRLRRSSAQSGVNGANYIIPSSPRQYSNRQNNISFSTTNHLLT